MSTRFLLDENLSPIAAQYLASKFGLNVRHVYELNLHGVSDDDIVKLARQEDFVIITFDLDFGEVYYRIERERIGVIILRLDDQTIESVNRVLSRFFQTHASELSLETSLVVLESHRTRVVSEPAD